MKFVVTPPKGIDCEELEILLIEHDKKRDIVDCAVYRRAVSVTIEKPQGEDLLKAILGRLHKALKDRGIKGECTWELA